eukprot:607808-Prorocentrum_minimum.AAC.1
MRSPVRAWQPLLRATTVHLSQGQVVPYVGAPYAGLQVASCKEKHPQALAWLRALFALAGGRLVAPILDISGARRAPSPLPTLTP